jgi:tetratricopeptide (TPR) repeat protein
LLAREAAFALLFLLPLAVTTICRAHGDAPSGRLQTQMIAPHALVLIAYLLVRQAVVDTPPLIGPPGDVPLGVRMLTMMNVLGRYVALLLVPTGLHMERQVVPATSPLDPHVLVGVAVGVALITIAVRARRTAWPVTFGITWFLLALVPVANLWPLATFMAEHWLYVPSMGLFLLAGWGVDRWARGGWRQPLMTAVVLVLAGFGALTIARNRDWRDSISLYEATVRAAPHSARAWTNLAHAYGEAGRAEQARDAYQRALRAMGEGTTTVVRRPSPQQEAQELALVANIEQQQGNSAEAERKFRAALARDPTLVSAYNNLGLTLNALGRPDEAEEAFASAIRLYPEFAAAHNNRGNMLFRRGDLATAKAAYEVAVRLNPEYAEAYNNLGSVSFRLGEPDRAIAAYQRALQLKPGLDEVRRNLAIVERARAQGNEETSPRRHGDTPRFHSRE